MSPIFEELVLLIRIVSGQVFPPVRQSLKKKKPLAKQKTNKKEYDYVSVTSVWLLEKHKVRAEMFRTSKI